MTENGLVQWPADPVKEDGSDVAFPTVTLLRQLDLLPEAGDRDEDKVGPLGGTPYSLQVINSGALALNKWWATVLAAGGGAAAVWASVQAYFADQYASVQVALVIAAAAVAAAALLSVAIIVRSDVMARAAASVAQYAARAKVASVFLRAASDVHAPQTPTDDKQGLWATVPTEGSKPFLVVGSRVTNGETSYLLARDDEKPQWKPEADVASWSVEEGAPS